ncbi:hypothetical protein [Ornithinimicrobium pratense]|nr:hypothetical protein [Ornithinimicrobium pratense]
MDASTPAVIDRVVDGRYRVEAEIARGVWRPSTVPGTCAWTDRSR